MAKVGGNKTNGFTIHCDGIGEVLDYTRETTADHASHTTYDLKFYGNATWEQAVDMALHGWKEGVSDIGNRLDMINQHEDLITTGYQWDVTGDLFDVGTMLTGQPEHWLQPETEPAPRIIRVGVNCNFSHRVTSDQITNRGAAIVALIDKLQQNPRNIVELTVLTKVQRIRGTSQKGKSTSVELRINIGTSPLDLDGITFIIAHPSFLRRLFLATCEVTLDDTDCGAYGSVIESDRAGFDLFFGQDDMSNFYDIDSSAQWVQRQLEQQMETA